MAAGSPPEQPELRPGGVGILVSYAASRGRDARVAFMLARDLEQRHYHPEVVGRRQIRQAVIVQGRVCDATR